MKHALQSSKPSELSSGNRGQWLAFQYGEALQNDYTRPLPLIHQGKHFIFTMAEGTTGLLKKYLVKHATAQNTTLCPEKQVLWHQGIPDRIKSVNGSHFQNNLVTFCAKRHNIKWVLHIPFNPQASRKVKRYKGLLKAIPWVLAAGAWKHRDMNLGEVPWLVNTRRFDSHSGPAETKPLNSTGGDKVSIVHVAVEGSMDYSYLGKRQTHFYVCL